MPRRLGSMRGLRPLSLALLLIAASLLLYYLFHVRSKQEYFTDRNFRVMARIARQVEGRVNNAGVVLVNAVEGAEEKLESGNVDADRGCDALDLEAGQDAEDAEGFPKDVKGFLDLAPEIGFVSLEGSATDGDESPPGEDRSPTETRFRIDRRAGDATLDLVYASQIGRSDDRTCDVVLRAEAHLAALAGDLHHYDLFDEVVVADGRGSVLLQSQRSGVSLADLRHLERLGTDGESRELIPLKALQSTSRKVEARIAGERQLLFFQPIRIHLERVSAAGAAEDRSDDSGDDAAAAEHEVRWLAGGIVRGDRFDADTRRMSVLVAIALLLPLALGLLAWPFLKVFYASATERFRGSDLGLLALSALVVVALLTLGTLDVTAYGMARARRDGELAKLAGEIETAFEKEIRLAHRQLVEGAELLHGDLPDPRRKATVSDEAGTAAADGDNPTLRANVYCNTSEPKEPDSTESGREDWCGTNPAKRLQKGPYPILEMLVWMDRDGDQLVKWSARSNTTSPGNFENRPYFQNALHRRLWRPSFLRSERPRPGNECPGPGIYLQVIRSRTTGETRDILSAPVSADGRITDCGDAEVAGVVTMVTNLRSLVGPVLPEGFGFSVIDESGTVLFHSDPWLRLEQNLFEEIEDSERLQSAVAARVGASFGSRYQGSEHQFLAEPLDGSPRGEGALDEAPEAGWPWWLVVHRDETFAHTANLEIVANALATLFAYLLGLIFVGIAIGLCAPRVVSEWIWPTPRNAATYVRCALAALLVFLGGAAVAHAIDFGATEGALLTFGAPVATGLLCAGTLAARKVVWQRIVPLALGLAGGLLAAAVASGDAWSYAVPAVGLLLLCLLGAASLWGEELSHWLNDRPSHRRLGFVVTALALLAVLAALPAVLAFEDAHRAGNDALTRLRQLDFGRSAAGWWEGIEPYERKQAELLCGKESRPSGRGDPDSICDVLAGLDCSERRSIPVKELPFAVYGAGLIGRYECGPAPSIAEEAAGTSADAPQPHFTSFSRGLQPAYNDVALRLRELARPASRDGSWRVAKEADGKGPLVLRLREGDRSIAVFADPPRLRFASHPLYAAGLAGMAAVAVLAVLGAARAIAGRLLGLGVDRPAVLAPPAGEWSSRRLARNHILHRLPRSERETLVEKLNAYPIDLRRVPDESSPTSWIDESRYARCSRVLLEPFEHRTGDPAFTHQKLLLVEELVYRREKPVYLASEVDPVALLRSGERGAGEQADLQRWSALLSGFDIAHFDPELDLVLPKDSPLYEECAWSPELHELAITLDRDDSPEETCRREILERARPVHQKAWDLSTREEKMVLSHLADGGLVNPRNWPVAARLEQRGLLARDPIYRIRSRCFARFVRGAATEQERRSWEEASGASVLSMIRGPLIALAAVLGVFFFATQPRAFTVSVGFLAAAAAGLPALLHLMGGFRPPRNPFGGQE